MADPFVFPAGCSVALAIMAIVSWYGMLRGGIQLVHDDWKTKQKYKQEIGNMMIDLENQERVLQSWKKKWLISSHTPDTILSTYWGDGELRIIQYKLKLIKSETEEAKKELIDLKVLEETDRTSIPDLKSRAKSIWKKTSLVKYIWTKKSYLRKLIDSVPGSMNTITDAADRGWADQQERLYGGISNNSAYHTQMASHLVRIARQMQHDLNALRMCTQALRDFSIELDLDMFGAFAAISKDVHTAKVAEAAAAGHFMVDLLLREADNPAAEMVRAKVERKRSQELPDVCATANVAFRSVMTAHGASVYHFALNTSTVFSLYKSVRRGDHCLPTRESLRQKISRNTPPSYNRNTNQLVPCTLILGELSTFRVAYELSQACLIFLRTTWISDLCGCGVHCGDRHHSAMDKWYEFGLNMEIAHQPPIWRNPYQLPGRIPEIVGNQDDSWCMDNGEWNALTKPIRRLGLLLLEIALGTTVMKTETDANGAVTHVVLLLLGTPPTFKKKHIRLEKALALVANAVHGSDGFTNAIRCCLTRTLDQTPFDDEWESLLKNLYFDVVKP